MVPEINYWAVLAATLASMLVGAIWYAQKVFGSYWMRAARVERNDDRSPVAPMIISLVAGFVTALVLAGAVYLSWDFYGGSYLVNGLLTAIILWAGLTAARFITHDAFEGRPRGLTLVTLGYEFTTILLMGFIIGIWPPAGLG